MVKGKDLTQGKEILDEEKPLMVELPLLFLSIPLARLVIPDDGLGNVLYRVIGQVPFFCHVFCSASKSASGPGTEITPPKYGDICTSVFLSARSAEVLSFFKPPYFAFQGN